MAESYVTLVAEYNSLFRVIVPDNQKMAGAEMLLDVM
jgi:hypothetical protein